MTSPAQAIQPSDAGILSLTLEQCDCSLTRTRLARRVSSPRLATRAGMIAVICGWERVKTIREHPCDVDADRAVQPDINGRKDRVSKRRAVQTSRRRA